VTNPNHPAWGILRFVVILGGLSLFLLVFSTRFDSTELLTIINTAVLMAGFYTAKTVATRGRK